MTSLVGLLDPGPRRQRSAKTWGGPMDDESPVLVLLRGRVRKVQCLAERSSDREY